MNCTYCAHPEGSHAMGGGCYARVFDLTSQVDLWCNCLGFGYPSEVAQERSLRERIQPEPGTSDDPVRLGGKPQPEEFYPCPHCDHPRSYHPDGYCEQRYCSCPGLTPVT